jgi:hypothetical protein
MVSWLHCFCDDAEQYGAKVGWSTAIHLSYSAARKERGAGQGQDITPRTDLQ